MLLAGAFLGVTWRGFRHTLEQAASPASYPTTSTRRLMNPTADARTGAWPMPTVAGIVVISSRAHKNNPARPFTKYTSSRSPCQEISLIYFGGGSLPLPAALPFCHPGAEGDRVQGKSSGYPLSGASIAGPATPRLPAQLLENFEEFKNHKLMRKSDSNMHNLHITF